MEEIKAITMPGIHKKFLSFLKKESIQKNAKVLDVGAGHGAFSKRLFDLGYDVSSCDLFPELFEFNEIECDKVDVTKKFPYEDNSFDAAIAIEVTEHINDHEVFFGELSRILKPEGRLYISTPNILSLKSRLRFLLSGFFYSFNPLELNNYDGLQHITSRTINQYNYIAIKNGFQNAKVETDKKQSTSKWLLIIFYPFLWLYQQRKKNTIIHNSKTLLLGRLLFLTFKNAKK